MSTADEAVQKADEIIAKTGQLKKGLMQLLLTKGIGHKKFKIIDSGPRKLNIPGEWDFVALGEFAELKTGGTPSTRVEEYWGGKIPWMVSGDIHKHYIQEVDGRITRKALENSPAKYIPKNSVLIALNGQGKTKGTVAINFIELTLNQSIAAYILNQNEFYPLFVYHYLTRQYKFLRSLSGDDRSGLNLTLLKTVEMPKPPLHEQKKIAKILSTVDKKLELERQRKETLLRIKKGLMQELLTGHKRLSKGFVARFEGEESGA